MWETLLKARANLDDLQQDLKRLEDDEATRVMISTILGSRRYRLSHTAETISQHLEALIRQMKRDNEK